MVIHRKEDMVKTRQKTVPKLPLSLIRTRSEVRILVCPLDKALRDNELRKAFFVAYGGDSRGAMPVLCRDGKEDNYHNSSAQQPAVFCCPGHRPPFAGGVRRWLGRTSLL